MIEILESPKHLVAMKISGKITAEDIEKAYKAGNEALKVSERVSFFAEITDSLFGGDVPQLVHHLLNSSELRPQDLEDVKLLIAQKEQELKVATPPKPRKKRGR